MKEPAMGTPRPRRSCLAVPGYEPEDAREGPGPAGRPGLPGTFEDAVAPLAKPDARKNIVAALNEGNWSGKVRTVRVNDLTTPWTYRDVIEVVEGPGPNLDCIMLPKVQGAEQIAWLDLTLNQIEKTIGLPVGGIGIEAQIENAADWSMWTPSPGASPRIETIIFGPATSWRRSTCRRWSWAR